MRGMTPFLTIKYTSSNAQKRFNTGNPSALIGTANLICKVLKEHTDESGVAHRYANERDLCRIANLEEAIVNQVSRQSFCPEFSY